MSPENDINRKRISTQAERQRVFSEKSSPRPNVCVHLSLRLALTLLIRTLLGYKEKQKKQIIFYIHQRCCCSPLYTTMIYYH